MVGGKSTELLLVELGLLFQNLNLLFPEALQKGEAGSFQEILGRELKVMLKEEQKDSPGAESSRETSGIPVKHRPEIPLPLPPLQEKLQTPGTRQDGEQAPEPFRPEELPTPGKPVQPPQSVPVKLPGREESPVLPGVSPRSEGEFPFAFSRETFHDPGVKERVETSFPIPGKVEREIPDPLPRTSGEKKEVEFQLPIEDKRKDLSGSQLRSRGEGEVLFYSSERPEPQLAKNQGPSNHSQPGLQEVQFLKEEKQTRKERGKEGEGRDFFLNLTSLADEERVSWEELRTQAIKKVKDIRIVDGGETKRITLKTEDVRIEAKLLKDSVSLRIFLQNQRDSLLSGIDFIKISQIFQSAGLRIESFSVNGNEFFRERVRYRERGNISVDGFVSEDNSSLDPGSSLSLLL